MGAGINAEDSLLTVLVERTPRAYQSNTAILPAYADTDEVNIGTIKSVKLDVNNLSIGCRFVYLWGYAGSTGVEEEVASLNGSCLFFQT